VSDDYGRPPETLSQDEKTWALVAHIGSLVAAYIALGFLAPLLVMLVKGDSSTFVRRHAVAGTVLAFLFTVMTVGLGILVVLPVALVLAVVALALIIMATVKASQGEDYRYPLTIRFIS
jgi:uncharacterized protein